MNDPPPRRSIAQQATDFANRLRKLARHLRRWPARGITCYRLYERDIPEIPLVVDRYEDRLHIAEFVRPHDRPPDEHAAWLRRMTETAAETLQVPLPHVYLKSRDRQRGNSQYERHNATGETLIVQEGGLKFRVNLSDYLDTGLFLDHRITRGMVRDAAEGKRVLNVFGYTGSFTVYAAAGGAVATKTIDLSRTYLDWAGENLRLNGLLQPRHAFVQADALSYIRQMPPTEVYDLAIVDPPTFSNSKRTTGDWETQRDYVALLDALLPHIQHGGVVFFSTNFRRFRWNDDACSEYDAREISHQTVPPDFRNRRIHRCWRLSRPRSPGK